MVNDFLKELYPNIVVPHIVRLLISALTIDKHLLSIVKFSIMRGYFHNITIFNYRMLAQSH